MRRDKPNKPVMRTIDGVTRQVVEKPKPWNKKHSKLGQAALAIVGLLLVGLAIYFLQHYQNRTSNTPDDIASVITAVSKHYQLPNDEEPALATVTDATKVASSFRGLTTNGDRILIYQKNQIAIAYRPSTDRIVTVVPVTIDTPRGGQQTQ